MKLSGIGTLLMLAGMMMVAACSSGGDNSGSDSSSPPAAPTAQAKGTINQVEIGGTDLNALSAQQETTSPIQGGSFTVTVSTSGPQLLVIEDPNGVVRGLTFTMRSGSPSGTTPTIMTADATSTALALLLLSPGVTPADWSFAQPVVTALQSLSSFPAFVSFLQANMPSKTLPEIIADPRYDVLFSDCQNEWPAKSATITPSTATSIGVAAFAVPPQVNPLSVRPATETGGVRIDLIPGYTGAKDLKITLTNYSLRSVKIYQLLDETGDGNQLLPVNIPASLEVFKGAETPSLFSPASFIPNVITSELHFTNPKAKMRFYIVGAGFAASTTSIPPQIGFSESDKNLTGTLDFVKFVAAPAISLIYGVPASELLEVLLIAKELLKGEEFAKLATQVADFSKGQGVAVGSVLAYRELLHQMRGVALGKVAGLIKLNVKGLLRSVTRIGTILDALNLVHYVNQYVSLPAYALVQISSPYDKLEFSAPTYIVKKTDGQAKLDVTRTDGSNDTLEVKYTITPGTAIEGKDYSPPDTGLLQFNPGQKTATIAISIIDNKDNAGARHATVSLGPITKGLGQLGSPSSVSLTIGSPTVVNTCESDVPSYAPSGCEWPRIVAKNPYTPLQAGQPVAISELIAYRPGTCAEITWQIIQMPVSGSNWNLVGRHNVVGGTTPFQFLILSFLPWPPAQGPSPLSDLNSVMLQSTRSTDSRISIGSIFTRYDGDNFYVPALRSYSFSCSFAQGSG